MINRWVASSRTCFECKWYNHELKLSDTTWTCLGCGTLLDRDLNATKDINAEGLLVLEKRKHSQEVYFDEFSLLSKSGEARPKVEVIASTSRKTKPSPVNQKPSMVKESCAVA